MNFVRTVIRWLLGIIVLLLVVSLSLNALSYFNFNFTYGFLRLKQAAIATGWYLPAYYSHVLAAGLILILGLFQLRTTLSLRWRKLHRFLGKCYAYGILFFAAPGGLVMSFFINRGVWVLTSFILQSTCWFVFTALAVRAVKTGNIEEHGRWMWRSYALTFAAVTLRLYVFLFTSSYDMSAPEAYGIIAWLSWTVNLIVVEIYLRLKSTPLFSNK
ncbi:MAG TPA: DUF2306 domain-containing protein [Cyclobacteriaceae bacterium]|nr:DUF2306 domain-containing protein [Cyclobacteriaceae bacterium]HMV10128.1 DUF2306 domain-containing protein [Cyclobacteriaceae bacterium]HMV90354.1 DUF2306 domain-containing protein [Cyclobacteriaceae bacterium]HMX00557.1 DUF2306 domain-containing protein [Cyclobacteriaceae bacterium]HMX49568.1 DUF2306 domain-containing protein [Cyclobacteriaceae bacterium]